MKKIIYIDAANVILSAKNIDLKIVDKIVLCSGDGDFAHILDFAVRCGIEVKVIAVYPGSCSRVIKKRAFTRLSYLVDFGSDILNEKPPSST